MKKRIKISAKAIKHSNSGDFKRREDVRKKQDLPPHQKYILTGGGHGQANIRKLKRKKIGYNITRIFPNGVRLGNIPTHRHPYKRKGERQAWFPKSWNVLDIKNAAKKILSKEPFSRKYKEIGKKYKGVNMMVYINDGEVRTICPKYDQPTSNRKKKKWRK
ncbi:MAG: EndoU domain-containing protein [Christensenellales bacterium]|jgi:hypothetical protein|nr:hypothetical protein [Clostridiales bacterium]